MTMNHIKGSVQSRECYVGRFVRLVSIFWKDGSEREVVVKLSSDLEVFAVFSGDEVGVKYVSIFRLFRIFIKMSATKTIIISTPKFITAEPAFEVALAPGNSLLNTNIRKTSQMKRASFQCVSTMEKIACPPMPSSVLGIEASSPAPSRKRRLDHLSLEEKIQRKKLKNRIAAQSSRDRKKAKMDDLEVEVKELKDENKILTDRCLRLEEESQRLAEENKQLREQLSQTRRVGCEPTAATGPAESWAFDPPQQGRGMEPARGLVLLTLLLMAVSHRCPTSWMNLMARTSSPNSKSWQTASSRKVQTASLKKVLVSLSQMKERRRLLEVAREMTTLKWWGRHQKNWNPVEIQ